MEAFTTPHGTSWPIEVKADATTGRVMLFDEVSASAIISSFQTSTKLKTMPPIRVFDATGRATYQNTW
ncbi:hypothetical protein D3C72_2242970 [compost metagenome]